MTPRTPTTDTPDLLLDRWGNTIIGGAAGIGPMGQYCTERAVPWRATPLILRVCAEAGSERHLLWWDFNADERRMVCGLCWPITGQCAMPDEK